MVTATSKNHLLHAIVAEMPSLLPHIQEIEAPLNMSLYRPDQEPRFAHFVTGGVASIVTLMKNGDGAEVGMVGPEGVVEAFHLLGSAILPTIGVMQVEGSALRMPMSMLQQAFGESDAVRQLLLQYVQQQSLISTQLAGCNRLHGAEERLSRWLLMVQDRVGLPEFHITQQFLAEMIGAERTTVTLVAGALQRSGLISYSRGRIRIIDRESLEGAACECYAVVRDLTMTSEDPKA